MTFTRKTYSNNASTGGRDVVETTYSENIRITKKNNTDIVLNTDVGEFKSSKDYVLLGNYLSNMKATNDIIDTFVFEGHLYKITSVMINKEKEEITSVQAIAECIKG